MAATTKKAITMADQTPKQLKALMITKQANLLGYKKGLKIGELKNPGVIKATRKEIARIKTALSMNMAGDKEGDK